MVVEEQKKGFIYLLTNLVNGKKYVGQTRAKTVERRWTAHIMMATAAKPAVLIHRAIKKYGVNKFSAEVLWTGPVDKLNIKETHFIKVHDSFVDDGHSGYNLTRGGGTHSKSKQVIRKHVKAAKRRWTDPEQRRKQSESKKLQWLDPEYRARAIASRIGMKLSKSACRKISKARKGSKASEETKQKMSESHKRRYAENPELHFLVGAGNRGNHAPKSKAAKQHMHEAAVLRWARPEEHEKASTWQLGLKKAPHSLETRAKMSATSKSRWQDADYIAAHKKGA
jgi:group I intron endonuclease